MTFRPKIAAIVLIGSKAGRCGGHLENLFFASSPEPKGQLTRNLVGSIRVTCRSKNSYNHSDLKSKMVAVVAILKIYFSLLLLCPDQTIHTVKTGPSKFVDLLCKQHCFYKLMIKPLIRLSEQTGPLLLSCDKRYFHGLCII